MVPRISRDADIPEWVRSLVFCTEKANAKMRGSFPVAPGIFLQVGQKDVPPPRPPCTGRGGSPCLLVGWASCVRLEGPPPSLRSPTHRVISGCHGTTPQWGLNDNYSLLIRGPEV